jgi:hypothetical protein
MQPMMNTFLFAAVVSQESSQYGEVKRWLEGLSAAGAVAGWRQGVEGARSVLPVYVLFLPFVV